MKIFITGGAGYVGSMLIPALLDQGHQITIYDLNIYDRLLLKCNVFQIREDIRNNQALLRFSKNHDVMIHLASTATPSIGLKNPNISKSINLDAFDNIISACKVNKIKRLIVASSTSQYGIKPLDMEVVEETKAEPITDYGEYKIKCEEMLQNTDMGDTIWTITRPSTLCGYSPRLRLDLSLNTLTIHALVNNKIKIFGGDQMRPTLNIKDMIRFYELLITAPEDKIHKQAFNVLYENKSIKELAGLVKEVIGDHIQFEFTSTDDKRSYHVNADKMKRILGFECKYDLKEAVRSLIKAYQEGLIKDGLNNPIYYNIKQINEINLK